MKCLYTEALLSQSGSQLVIYPVAKHRLDVTAEKEIKRVWPDAWMSFNDLMEMARSADLEMPEEEQPQVGDVVWVETGGNKTLGFCIVREDYNSEINTKALKPVFNSVAKKAKQLGIEYYGMDLFSCRDGREWADIVDEVEQNSMEVQAIVCIPTNELLEDVMTELEGNEFRAIKLKE